VKKSAIAAAALAGVTAISGAATLPGSAASDSHVQTIRFVQRELTHHEFTPNTFAGASRVRSAGEIAGYVSFAGRLLPKKEKVHVQLAYALRGGIILVRVSIPFRSARFRGSIINGSGRYNGVQGTLTGRFAQGDAAKTFVTLNYHF
jgi:hypothetical protein